MNVRASPPRPNAQSTEARLIQTYRAGARPAAAGSGIARHLVLAYRPGWQAIEDLNEIAGHVRDIDRSIATFILPATSRNAVSQKAAGGRPTLVVSPGWMAAFRPLRGKVYQGRPIPKAEQLMRLAAGGVPVPRSAMLTPELQLDPAEWGEFVILKPTDLRWSSSGRGIQLMRTHRVRYRRPEDYPAGHPGRAGPMMVQQFIDTGERLAVYRVLTLFGEPLYAMLYRSRMVRVGLDQPDAAIEAAVVAIQAAGDRERLLIDDPDVLAVARAADAALPEIPLKGTDLLRDAATGALYVLEVNPGGNTWHFSSAMSAETRAKYGPEFELRKRRQFDAFRTAARVLVERTNAEAE